MKRILALSLVFVLLFSCAWAESAQPYFAPCEDYITEKVTTVDVGPFSYKIGKGIYVRSDLKEISEVIAPLMEQVSGLKFKKKAIIEISRDRLYAGQDWYKGSPESEVGSAYASKTTAYIAPADLFLGNSTLIHEVTHVLAGHQTTASFCQLLSEALSTYTTYLVELELEKNYPQIGAVVGDSARSVSNMTITSHSKLYAKPLEYWFENTFEYAGNVNYAIGFRFAAYLHRVYGNYTAWLTKYQEMYPNDKQPSAQMQVEVLKATYGEDVLDKFYPWLKKNQKLFKETKFTRDLTQAQSIRLYPTFDAATSSVPMNKFKFDNLYIDLEPMRLYLKDYKQKDVSKLTLHTSGNTTVKLFMEDGTVKTVKNKKKFSLDGVSYIQLVGKKTLNKLEIKGAK